MLSVVANSCFGNDRSSSVNSARRVQVEKLIIHSFYAYLESRFRCELLFGGKYR